MICAYNYASGEGIRVFGYPDHPFVHCVYFVACTINTSSSLIEGFPSSLLEREWDWVKECETEWEIDRYTELFMEIGNGK